MHPEDDPLDVCDDYEPEAFEEEWDDEDDDEFLGEPKRTIDEDDTEET